MLQLSSRAAINAVIWIHSLREGERGFADRAIDDLQPLLLSQQVYFQSFEPRTAAELQNYLSQIATAAQKGLRPIIHFDTHGSALHGLCIAGSNECVSWATLVSWLRPINIATENNLCLVSGACFSMNVYSDISVEQECPFYVMIAPLNIVLFDFTATNVIRFYEDIFANWDIVATYKKHLQKKLTLFHCEKVFFVAMGRYIRNNCLGVGGKKRRERLLTQVLTERRLPNTPIVRKSIRRQIRNMIRPTQALVDRYVKQFLIGKKVPFTLGDIMREVRKSIAREKPRPATNKAASGKRR